VQYPGLQGGGALGDASTPGTPADSIAASAHGGTHSHVAVAGETWGGEKGAAAGTVTAAARRRRATPTGGAFTPPLSAPLNAPLDGRPTGGRNRSRCAGTITRGSSRARSTPVVAARGRRAQLGAVGGESTPNNPYRVHIPSDLRAPRTRTCREMIGCRTSSDPDVNTGAQVRCIY